MENEQDNPIIYRLKQFLASTGLSSTHFADKAGIPRPTLSQLLHGRNKSINNQILSKLDESFPELNTLWLLFGRGGRRFAEPECPETDREIGRGGFRCLECECHMFFSGR